MPLERPPSTTGGRLAMSAVPGMVESPAPTSRSSRHVAPPALRPRPRSRARPGGGGVRRRGPLAQPCRRPHARARGRCREHAGRRRGGPLGGDAGPVTDGAGHGPRRAPSRDLGGDRHHPKDRGRLGGPGEKGRDDRRGRHLDGRRTGGRRGGSGAGRGVVDARRCGRLPAGRRVGSARPQPRVQLGPDRVADRRHRDGRGGRGARSTTPTSSGRCRAGGPVWGS